MKRFLHAGPFAILALSASAFGGIAIEVSKDGRETARVDATQPPIVELRGSGGVPYGETPDWQNSLRRQVSSLQFADMNQDGWLDLVVGCYSSQSFPPYNDWENLIYYNNGGQLESSPSWISADEVSTTDIQIGDVNMDGHPDIVAINGGFTTTPYVIYFGSVSGPSTSPNWTANVPIRAFGVGGTLFDFDHDGDLDLFTANQGTTNDPYRPMLGFRNNNGMLETSAFWQSGEFSIQNTLAFADYDGDGWEDLAVTKWVNFETGIYRNINGVLQISPTWTTGIPSADRGLAWGDIDGNGDPDLALGADVTRLYSNFDGVLSIGWNGGAPFYSHQEVRLADVDNDGDLDLAAIHFGDGRTHIYLNDNGQLALQPSWTYDSPTVGNALAFGDVNGDGWIDMATGHSGDPSVNVFLAHPPVTTPGDMNCDGIVSVTDIAAFVLALTDPAGYAVQFPGCEILNADLNNDGVVSVGDIGPFVALLTAG